MKTEESPAGVSYNFTSLKHCIKRIHKSCQIQLEDYQWRNGPDTSKVSDEIQLMQTQLLQEVIQVEQ